MYESTTEGASPQASSAQAMTARLAAVGTALLLVVFLVLTVSRAAFTASTGNEDNFVTTTGTVTLTDDDTGSALFEVTDAAPGTPTVRCISVRYAGAFDSGNVNMYAGQNLAGDPLGDLAAYLDVTVERIALVDAPLVPNATHSCATFIAADILEDPTTIYDDTLANFPTAYATGVDAFAGTASSYAFRITVEVQNTPEAANSRADWNFTWETQSA